MEGKRNHPTGLQRLMIVAASLLSILALAAVSAGLWSYSAPLPDRPAHLTVETLSRMTPVKQQGGTQLCWAYAMLAAIETEHFREGDSLNLPIEPVVEALKSIPEVPPSRRAMGQTLLNLVQRCGIYRDVCNPDDFVPLCTTGGKPYGQWIVPKLPDNWEQNRFLNLHPDTLVSLVAQAVLAGRGVCWEGDIGERGFSFRQGDRRPLHGSCRYRPR